MNKNEGHQQRLPVTLKYSAPPRVGGLSCIVITGENKEKEKKKEKERKTMTRRWKRKVEKNKPKKGLCRLYVTAHEGSGSRVPIPSIDPRQDDLTENLRGFGVFQAPATPWTIGGRSIL